jgi:hypothetical protein
MVPERPVDRMVLSMDVRRYSAAHCREAGSWEDSRNLPACNCYGAKIRHTHSGLDRDAGGRGIPLDYAMTSAVVERMGLVRETNI